MNCIEFPGYLYRGTMNQLEVCIYQNGSSAPDKRITMPMSVLRINPRLLPKEIADALQGQGVSVSEIASLEGVEGTVMDINGEGSRITIAIQSGEPATGSPPPGPDTPKTITEQPVVPPAAPAPAAVAADRPRPSRADTPYLQKLTTEFIAAEIGWRTGHDLIYAAGAHLTMAEKQKSFSREEIDAEIRSVGKFYKPFYSTNLNEYLQYLMNHDKFCKSASGDYQLTPNMVKYLEERLSEEKLKKRRL